MPDAITDFILIMVAAIPVGAVLYAGAIAAVRIIEAVMGRGLWR